jgi:hypothetical protein
MKIKHLLLSFLTLSVFLVSCSKEDITGVDFESSKIEQSQTVNTTSTTNPNLRVNSSTESNLMAYVFVERQSRTSQIVNYLKNQPRNPQSTGTMFYGYFAGISVFPNNYRDLNNYYNMVLWNNGTLNSVITTEVPQSGGGVDSHGNPKLAYNFTTVKIPKGTLNEFAWITVLIPTSAMNNDTKKQNKIAYYAKNGNVITSSGNNNQTVINTNTTLSSYVIYSNGTVIPQGNYRVYTTYSGTGMRVRFNTTNDVYLRGFSN